MLHQMVLALTLLSWSLSTRSHSSKPLRYVQAPQMVWSLLLTLEQYVRPRGTVVAIGLPAGAYLRAPVFETVMGMKTIKGSYVGNRKDTSEAIDFYRRGLINAPYKVIGMSQLQKVYDMMHEGKIAGRYVVDTSK